MSISYAGWHRIAFLRVDNFITCANVEFIVVKLCFDLNTRWQILILKRMFWAGIPDKWSGSSICFECTKCDSNVTSRATDAENVRRIVVMGCLFTESQTATMEWKAILIGCLIKRKKLWFVSHSIDAPIGISLGRLSHLLFAVGFVYKSQFIARIIRQAFARVNSTALPCHA